MKIGIKEFIIICLVGIVCLLAGILLAQKPVVDPVVYQQPADDGKLSKRYKDENLVAKIRNKASELQRCYFIYLESSPETKEGVVKILFKVEEDGLIGKTQITENEFKNTQLSKCILAQFEKTYLSPPPLGINRYISHDLDFKLEETAIKEAKEREARNQPPKILPVN